MVRIVAGVSVACLVALSPWAARAESKGDAKAVVERAVTALGGQENLSKYKAAHLKGKGTFSGMGQPFPFTAEWWQDLPGQRKTRFDFEMNGTKMTRIEVLSGDKGWASMNDEVEELADEMLKEAKEGLYAGTVVNLVGVLDGNHQLMLAGESPVDGKPAVGVKVSSKGHRDITVYFDKESGLPVKSQTRAKDMMTSDEVDQEALYSGYKDFGGVKRPTKEVVKRSGKDFLDWQVTEYQPLEKLDASTFAKPGK